MPIVNQIQTISISDRIQIISIICTSILSIIAIVISVLTLIQNNKMIFESNKPYLSILAKTINFTSPRLYLVLKNFGTSGATISNIEYDEIFNCFFKKKPFEHMKNVFIAPNQTFLYPLNKSDNLCKPVNFKITYQYLGKTYIENCCVNFDQFSDICYLKTHCSNDVKELSEILQEMTIQNI